MTVDRVATRAEAREILGEEPWDATDHLFAGQHTTFVDDRVVPIDVVKAMTCVRESGLQPPKLLGDGLLDQQPFRQPTEITAATALALDAVIEDDHARGPASAPPGDGSAVPLNEARVRDSIRVLCRIPIPWGQAILYRLAYEHPETGFTSTRLREVVGLNLAQHRGLMAALAVRINHTPNETSPGAKPGVKLLFDQTWNGDEYTYRPHPELLEAIRRLPELQAAMLRPIEKVVRSPTSWFSIRPMCLASPRLQHPSR